METNHIDTTAPAVVELSLRQDGHLGRTNNPQKHRVATQKSSAQGHVHTHKPWGLSRAFGVAASEVTCASYSYSVASNNSDTKYVPV